MDFDELTKYDSFRVMPTKILSVKELDGHPIVQMSYCDPSEASSWAVEGVYSLGQDEEVDFICECLEQFTAYTIKEFIEKEHQYQQGELHLKNLQERRSNVGHSNN